MPDYIDLRITHDDLSLDVGGNPALLCDRASIAQDIIHMIRERGYLTAMIANRDARARKSLMVRITMDVDNDERIIPGTALLEESAAGELWLTAQTQKYGPLSLQLEA